MKIKENIKVWAILFWLIVWQGASMLLGQQLVLVSPVATIERLCTLAIQHAFWQSIAFSLLRIASGLVCGTIIACVFAILSVRYQRVREWIAPLILVIKTIPVASFIILALVFLSSKNLSIFISFLMVLPVLYENIVVGIEQSDSSLKEMTNVFHFSTYKKVRYMYVPQVYPYFRAGSMSALGLCWKAGIAAEVIGMPTGSIGEHLQQAKVYLDTPDLYAWTLTIAIISLLFQKGILYVLDILYQRSQCVVVQKESPRQSMQRGWIDIDHVTKTYENHCVLDDVSMHVKAGQIIGIMAPSGAGKTTLLRLILGLEQPDEGQIRMESDTTFATVFQEDRLLTSLCAQDNVRIVHTSLDDQQLKSAFDQYGIGQARYSSIQALSGGMKRRVAILRALVAPSDILILDEPFQGLDEKNRRKVMDATKQRIQDKTVILVSHNREELTYMGVDIIVEL